MQRPGMIPSGLCGNLKSTLALLPFGHPLHDTDIAIVWQSWAKDYMSTMTRTCGLWCRPKTIDSLNPPGGPISGQRRIYATIFHFLDFLRIPTCLPFTWTGNATEVVALPRRFFNVCDLGVCRFLAVAGMLSEISMPANGKYKIRG